jgi:ubiquinone/menaquinone biosynthesis C-methylase UbiE
VLKEVAHFAWHSPRVLWKKWRLSQSELYDDVIGAADRAGFAEQRSALVSDLRGEVLEIGVGTGAMLAHYGAKAKVTGLELDPEFLERAKQRKDIAATVDLREGNAESLAFDAGRFDAVVAALVLCSVDSPEKVLAGIRRVLKPGGELRLVEHVVSDRPVAAALMRTFDPVWLKLNGQGCRMSRDTEATLEHASFEIVERHPFQIFAPGLPAFPMRRLRAVP